MAKKPLDHGHITKSSKNLKNLLFSMLQIHFLSFNNTEIILRKFRSRLSNDNNFKVPEKHMNLWAF